MSSWQTIDTAPLDRDVWVGSCPFLWQGQAGWDENDLSWITTSYDDKGRPLKVLPTHWMPLPSLPEPVASAAIKAVEENPHT